MAIWSPRLTLSLTFTLISLRYLYRVSIPSSCLIRISWFAIEVISPSPTAYTLLPSSTSKSMPEWL